MISFETIQNEVAQWPEENVRRLQGFLVAMTHQRDGRLQSFARKLDDTSPGKWVSLEDAEVQLGLGPHDHE